MSSLDYIVLPIETDALELLDDSYSYLQDQIPGWTPADGQLDTQMLQSVSTVAAESREVASAVTKSIFRWFGATLVGLPPIDATPATSSVTFTMIDANGHTVPAGTQLSIVDNAGVGQAFDTDADLIIYTGNTTGVVNVTAIIPGEDGSGLGSAGSPVELLDPLDFVSTVTMVATTSGGVDAESDAEYLNRLSAELTLLAPRPILPNDFTIFARNIPGVARAVAIDLYDPGPPPVTPKDRCVTIAAIDENGNPVSSSVKAAIDADLQARREINFKIFVIDPTVTNIAVVYTATALAGYDHATLKTDVNNSIKAYLSPATWGTGQGGAITWSQTTYVRYLEIAQAINATTGVDYINSLTFGIAGGAMGTTDIQLPGIAPLATTSDANITGTIN